MPLYEFQCKCGNKFDKLCTVGAESCKCDCGKIAKKLISLPQVIFKGGGWTVNDNIMKDQTKAVNQEINNIKENI